LFVEVGGSFLSTLTAVPTEVHVEAIPDATPCSWSETPVAAGERHPDGFDAVLDLVNYAPNVPASLVKDGGRVASPTGAAGEDDGHGRTDAREP
jgi:hypothetical protein